MTFNVLKDIAATGRNNSSLDKLIAVEIGEWLPELRERKLLLSHLGPILGERVAATSDGYRFSANKRACGQLYSQGRQGLSVDRITSGEHSDRPECRQRTLHGTLRSRYI